MILKKKIRTKDLEGTFDAIVEDHGDSAIYYDHRASIKWFSDDMFATSAKIDVFGPESHFVAAAIGRYLLHRFPKLGPDGTR